MKQASRVPVVTLALVAVNIAAAYILLLMHPEWVLDYGFDAAKPTALAAFTCLFLHQNVLHLLGNMVFLAAVGPAVESAAGQLRFILVYFLGGLFGVAAFWFFARQTSDPAPLIGASGAIASCIAYYSVRYTHMHVMVAPKRGVPIVAVTGVWLVLQVLGAFVSVGGPAGGQAFWAHLGGFGAGLILSAVFRATADANRHAGHIVMDRLQERSHTAKLAATDLHLADHPEDLVALEKKADTLGMLGDREAEGEVLLAMLDILPQGKHPETLARLIGIGQISRISSLKRTLLAEKLRSTHPDLSKGLLLSVVGGDPQDRQRPDALLALATQAEPPERDSWIAELKDRYPLHPACELARHRGLL